MCVLIATTVLAPSIAKSVDGQHKDALSGTVVNSWVANSFQKQKGHHFVPVNISALAATADGTVFSSGCAEGYGGVGSYKDGKFVTKYDYSSGFASNSNAIAADDTYVYIGTGVGLFRTRRGQEGQNRSTIAAGDIKGLAIRDGELYVSQARGQIQVYSTETMKLLRSFDAGHPGQIAVGADGRVWTVQGKDGKPPHPTGGLKILSYSKDGKAGAEITDFENPCTLAFDPKGRLLVGGLNKHNQIRIYDVSGAPKKVETFGADGGIFSGEPGVYGPQKFHWVRGLAFDKAGNLYVGSVLGSWYNVLVEAYDPSGKLLWNVYGLGNWLDTACIDPADETVVYTKENVFKMDWSKPAGSEQILTGLTVDRWKYPLDCRVTDGHGPSHRLMNGVRRIDGKLFLYCGYQGTGSLEVYKFDKGCVGIPCAYVAGASTWRPGNGKRWPEDGETFIWTDANGDGTPQIEEYAGVERKPRWGFMHLDAAAGIWQSNGEGTIFHMPCEGLDQNGNPIYRRSSEVAYPYPTEAGAKRFRRMFYIPPEDAMVLGCSVPANDQKGNSGLICYEHWSDKARRTVRWATQMPANDTSYTPETSYGGGYPEAMQACGKYVFIAYGYGIIRVHQLDDGKYVGTIYPDINGFHGGGGTVDSDNALNVTLRKNGEYVLFLENAGLNHVMMFRWTPETKKPEQE